MLEAGDGVNVHRRDCGPIHPEEDGESSLARMRTELTPPTVEVMKKRLYFILLVTGLLLLALGGWTVQGLRRVGAVAVPAFGS